MHRQLSAAVALGAVPDASAVPASAFAAAPPTTREAEEAVPEMVSIEKTVVHEFVHGESWLVLAGQMAVAVALGGGYERFRSRTK